MRPLAALLEELFALHGHQVTAEAPLEGMSGTVYTIPILAEQGGRAYVVSGQLDGAPVSAQAVAEFAGTVADVGADLGVLVHTGPCPAEAAEAAGLRVVLWSRPTVIRLLGEAQVAASLEETPAPLPLDVAAATPAAQDATHQDWALAESPSDPETLAAASLSDLLPAAFQDDGSYPERAAPEASPEPRALDPAAEAPLPDLSALLSSDAPAQAAAQGGWTGEQLEAPRKPRLPEDDDFSPFPPIERQAVLPLPPPLPVEWESLPPSHPLAQVLPQEPAFAPPPSLMEPPAVLPLMGSAGAHARPPRPTGHAPAPRPAPEPPQPSWSAAPAASASFGGLADASRSFLPAFTAPPPPQPQYRAMGQSAPRSAPPVPAASTGPAYPAPATHAMPMPHPAQAPPPAGHPFPTASKSTLPVRVRLEDAKLLVKERLFSVRHAEVLLQPVHLYDYECEVLREGSLASDTLDGRVQVHGSDKGTLDVDPDRANPNAPSLLAPGHPYAVEERVLRVPEERARALALQHVIRRHTRTISVRIPDHNHGLFCTEKRKVEPTTDQVRLTHVGVFLRPVWRLHGANGIVDIDANDGREVMSELRGHRTDAILID